MFSELLFFVTKNNNSVMPFTKGHTLSPGRKKGQLNKSTKTTRSMLTAIMDKNYDKVERVLSDLEGKEYVDAITKLLPYIAPKLQAIAVQDNREGEQVSITFMTSRQNHD